jgi:hypothetical protein
MRSLASGSADLTSLAGLTSSRNTLLLTKPLNLKQVLTTVHQMVQAA